MRPRMNDVRSYVAPFTLGEAMTGGAVGRVAASRNARYAEGRLGAARARLARVGALRRRGAAPGRSRRRARSRPRSASSGCRGSPPATASSSSAARRRARRCSSRARRARSAAPPGRWRRSPAAVCIGSAGSAEKLAWLRELGFDEVFDYREQSRAGCARRARARRDRHLLRQRRRRPARGGASERCGRTGASSRAARSRATTTSSRRPGRGTCSWS